MSDLQSPASDRAPIADTPARSDHAPIADTLARAAVSTNMMGPGFQMPGIMSLPVTGSEHPAVLAAFVRVSVTLACQWRCRGSLASQHGPSEDRDMSESDRGTEPGPGRPRRAGTRLIMNILNLSARFDALVYNCSLEMCNMNECFLKFGSESENCKDLRASFGKCQSKMNVDLGTINAVCGSQYENYTRCMHINSNSDMERCSQPLREFVACAEVSKQTFSMIIANLIRLAHRVSRCEAKFDILNLRRRCWHLLKICFFAISWDCSP